MSDDIRHIEITALRIARLAALKAPAIILADQVNLLVKRTEAVCAAQGFTLA